MRKKKEKNDLNDLKKSNPKIKSHHSLLQKHNERILQFSNKKERIHTLNNKIKSYENIIKKPKDTTNILEIKQNIVNLNNEKNSIINGDDETTYILESYHIIQKYINVEETESRLLTLKNLSKEENDLLNKSRIQKHELMNEYLIKFENTSDNIDRRLNMSCSKCNIPFVVENCFLICSNCGLCEGNTVELSLELSYKELQDYEYKPQYTYEKKSHLEDWLRRFKDTENRSIPQEILDKVILEAKKSRIKDLNDLTEDIVKKFLKKLNLNVYYDNVIGIINRINNRPPFKLTSEVEDKIHKMFQQIQEPYEKYKPPNRKNFLSYSYTLNKLFRILGLVEFSQYFPLLKSVDKLRQQDEIFQKIVLHMVQIDPTTKWVFYPSL